MQKKNVKTFHLVESEPHPLVARALNTDLWTRCRIENPAPVHFLPIPRWSGLCPDIQDTKEGEIRIADHLLSNSKNEDWMANRLMLVYLHELSHRLTPGHDHDAAFFAVNALLLLRAGSDNHGGPLLHDMGLYDLHEWQDAPHSQIGEALDWALAVAGELVDVDMSAEAAAETVFTDTARKSGPKRRRSPQNRRCANTLKNWLMPAIAGRWLLLSPGGCLSPNFLT